MAEQEVETEDNPLKDLVQHSLDQDYNKANKSNYKCWKSSVGHISDVCIKVCTSYCRS